MYKAGKKGPISDYIDLFQFFIYINNKYETYKILIWNKQSDVKMCYCIILFIKQ